jgi:hypothetical protein
MSGVSRYTPDWPPFRPPAGDARAIAAAAVLREFSASASKQSCIA